MDSQRPKRTTRKPKRYENSTPSVPSESEVAQKVIKRKEQNAPLRPIAAESVPQPDLLECKLPHYHPPLEYTKGGGNSLVQGMTQLQLFLQFFSLEIMAIIMAAINSYGERTNRTETKRRKPNSPEHRRWYSSNASELYRYFGYLLYLGIHQEPKYWEYWKVDDANLGKYLSLKRYEQINLFFTLRDRVTHLLKKDEEWF